MSDVQGQAPELTSEEAIHFKVLLERAKDLGVNPMDLVQQGLDGTGPGVMVDVDRLEPNIWNPNEMNNNQFNRLCQEISEVGFIVPIQAVKIEGDRWRIVGGEHRWNAARALGMQQVPVFPLTDEMFKDDDLCKFVSMRLNVIHGGHNRDKFLAMYNEMCQRYDHEALQKLMGYTDSEKFNKLVGHLKRTIKKVGLPSEVGKNFSDKVKDAKNVQDLNRIVKSMFNEYGKDLEHQFMILSFGGKEHIYIRMSEAMNKVMKDVQKYCRKNKVDINDVMEPIVKRFKSVVDVKKNKEKVKN